MKSDIDIYLTRVTNGIFSVEIPLHTDELWDNQKIVVLRRIIWSGCTDIFRTCPWSHGSQNSTNATQPNCTCLNHKERDKQKGFLRAGEGGIILLETIFWLDCADVFQSQDKRCSDINHVVIKRMICACRSRTYIFSATFSRIKTALFMYKHIHKHAPIRLRRCISAVFRQNLSWEWLNFRNLYKLWSDKYYAQTCLHFPASTGFAKTQSNNYRYRMFNHWSDKDCLAVR